MTKLTATVPGKGKLRCGSCKQVFSPKDGDWFIVPDSTGQQVFLCKACESSHTNHKRANLSRT